MTTEEFVLSHTGLAWALAKRVSGRGPGIDMDDLVQVALIAFWMAARTFDASRTTFATYGGNRAKWAMRKAARSQGDTIRIPEYICGEERTELRGRLMCDLIDWEADASEREGDDSADAACTKVEAILCGLTGRERDVIEARLAGDGDAVLAERWGVSRQRVFQVRQRLYARLRAAGPA